MHGAERHVAVHGRVGDDTETVDIHELRERLVLVAHLRIDAPRRLDPAYRAAGNLLRGEAAFERHLDLRHRLAAIAQGGADALADDPVTIGVKRLESEILQFGLELVHAEALRDGRVDFQCLASDAPARFSILRAERAHVVQSIGKLDQDDAEIARHGQQHLAEALGIGFGTAGKTHLVELGDAIDQFGHGFTEGTGQLRAF